MQAGFGGRAGGLPGGPRGGAARVVTVNAGSLPKMDVVDDGPGDDCAQCGMRQSSASNMTNTAFQINGDAKCGHRFCGMCIHDIFTNQGKRQFACKACTAAGKSCVVKRERLSAKSVEETEAERDVRLRRRIKAIYNKTVEDFSSPSVFRDYEEEVEDIIYNLVHDIDVAESNARIERYRKENEEAIFFNQSRSMEQREELDRRIQSQAESLQQKLTDAHDAAQRERLLKREHARQLNEVMLGERDAVNMQAFSAGQGAGAGAGVGGASAQDGAAMINPAQYSANHVFALLHPRELPKPTSTQGQGTGQTGGRTQSNNEKRLAHAAGGYDERNRWRRNWAEIVSHPAIARGGGSVPLWD